MHLEKMVLLEDVSVRKYLVGRELSDKECQEPLRLLKPMELGDLVFRRSSYGTYNVTNVPRRFWYSYGFSWGYSGQGPYDLGLNVLFHFSGGDEAFTRKHLHLFVKEVIAKFPMDRPLSIQGDFIKSWVSDKVEKPIEDGSIIRNSFAGGALCPGHLVWTDARETVLTPSELE